MGTGFVASYNDYIDIDSEMFSVSNALFALPSLAVNEQKPLPAGAPAVRSSADVALVA